MWEENNDIPFLRVFLFKSTKWKSGHFQRNRINIFWLISMNWMITVFGAWSTFTKLPNELCKCDLCECKPAFLPIHYTEARKQVSYKVWVCVCLHFKPHSVIYKSENIYVYCVFFVTSSNAVDRKIPKILIIQFMDIMFFSCFCSIQKRK